MTAARPAHKPSRFTSTDGTCLAYRLVGQGDPLLCLPGGPGRAVRYLGDLGGLSKHRTLVLLDPRGTGESEEPIDGGSYRFDRLADDVEALRIHLGVSRVDVLGHSAGAGVALRFAVDHPERLRRLVLLTPSLRSVDLAPTDAEFDSILTRRDSEPWFADVVAAVGAVRQGGGDRVELAPLFYGVWSAAAQAHAAEEDAEHGEAAAAGFYADGAADADSTKAGLGRITSPVLVYSGELDPVSPPICCARLARLFPHATHVTQPGGAHFPWIDDPVAVATRIAAFLA